ncbi:MAG: hypothetical protein ACREIT_00505 [Tepidisphaeraceae bacterium]
MSQLSRPANYLLIEDQLDAVGQKYRVQVLVRGAILWVAFAVLSSLVAGLAAHFTGQGTGAMIVLAMWLAWLVVSAAVWVLRPLLMHPQPVEVARLVESKLPGLHNGLTNSVLLARSSDLRENPWLPVIFDEILVQTRKKSLDEAVKLAELTPLAKRLSFAIVPAILIALIFPGPFVHGWKQMFAPSKFVPVVGSMAILDVQPRNATLVMGQPLEISITAQGPDQPNARIFFDDAKLAAASVVPSPKADGKLQYTYRLDHVDASMRFRAEVGSTQSPWYPVTVVRQIKLTNLALTVTPPLYTKQPAKTTTLKPEEIQKTPITVPQGSKVDLVVGTDVPVGGAMLQAGDEAPAPMKQPPGSAGQRFAGSLRITRDTPVAVLLAQDSGQIIARLPEQALLIQATKDAAPSITLKWPTQDTVVAPNAGLKIVADLADDLGISVARVLMAEGAEGNLAVTGEQTYPENPPTAELSYVFNHLKPELRKHGNSIRVQVELWDNRDLREVSAELGPQSVTSPVYEIKFRDVEQIAKEDKEKADKLRARLMEMLKLQQSLHAQAVAFGGGGEDVGPIKKVGAGQADLRLMMQQTAQTFTFDDDTKVVQKTLLVLAAGPAREAVELTGSIASEPVETERRKLNRGLQEKQRRIITTLESLLALLNHSPQPTTQPATRPQSDLVTRPEALKKLNEQLKEFMKQEQRILDQTASLAKKPVDNWDDADRKLLEELQQSQEKLDAFMKSAVNDFSKLTEQDMANASTLEQLYEVYSEVTMAKDALKAKAVEMATALEDNAMGLAREMSLNIEKWLMDAPDRIKWQMEDPVTKHDIPMPELPKELEDMVGELMEDQEDLFEEMEDANANWAASEGSGWDAADGPIESMSAQGVTGNALPNNNDLGGRSGEGRSGRSQGEMVEDTASGKGGRNTPTRLDPTPFQQDQVKDTGKDPTGGATGGGKISGQGGRGLEGPVPPQLKEEMGRLANKQAELRNTAERLNLQYKLGRYDNFKLHESIALMRRVESDVKANRYNNALRRQDVLVDAMGTSHLLLSGRIHVQQDTSPAIGGKLDEEINDAMKGQLPAAWSEALKEYYKKLGQQ